VRPINFDSNLFDAQKAKTDSYRFNDLKIDLINLLVSEATQKKSCIIRVECVLRDNYGVVYDTIYRTIVTDNRNGFNYQSSYESMIYGNESNGRSVTFGNESFFVRIPTKSLDTLKKIYLLFMVQVLAN
jgi:hypothetical protein